MLVFIENVEFCGSTKPGYTKIVGGRNAKPGNSPWQVVLNRENYSKGRFCGGVLISQEFVLTAAHCFDKQRNFSKYEVIVGEHFRFNLRYYLRLFFMVFIA